MGASVGAEQWRNDCHASKKGSGENEMKNIHLDNSYEIWRPKQMLFCIKAKAWSVYKNTDAEELLNRTMLSMYIEWWAHNIGYYLTKPFCKFAAVERLNKRLKDVDLQEWGADNG